MDQREELIQVEPGCRVRVRVRIGPANPARRVICCLHTTLSRSSRIDVRLSILRNKISLSDWPAHCVQRNDWGVNSVQPARPMHVFQKTCKSSTSVCRSIQLAELPSRQRLWELPNPYLANSASIPVNSSPSPSSSPPSSSPPSSPPPPSPPLSSLLCPSP